MWEWLSLQDHCRGDGIGYGSGDGDGFGMNCLYHNVEGGYGDGYGEYGLSTGDGIDRRVSVFYIGNATGGGDAMLDPPTPETDLGPRLTVANCMSRDAIHDACLAFELIQGDAFK